MLKAELKTYLARGNARADVRGSISPNFASAVINDRSVRVTPRTGVEGLLPEVNHHPPRREVVKPARSAGQKQAGASMTTWQLD